jgi:hypothetical protein
MATLMGAVNRYAASDPARVGHGVTTVTTLVSLMGAVNRYAASAPARVGLGVTTELTTHYGHPIAYWELSSQVWSLFPSHAVLVSGSPL